MILEEVFALQSGDEVYWEDPDGDMCSHYLTIQTIWVNGEVVAIHDTDGNYLECFAHELL